MTVGRPEVVRCVCVGGGGVWRSIPLRPFGCKGIAAPPPPPPPPPQLVGYPVVTQ